ncbi:hypothetical protein HOV38_gp06 [Raoultella phage RP180]|uniref:Uncharacterized protein n=1 Tax=Raoultella phage RP180 TaxID=2565500 RepID=A0A4D6DY34_9CAUD|nr:hypothetical protein HOV38_gp06 [Raoultella phage RP180]QBZ71261.1 hypothetical protein RP180_6 [Raoultella phage RP180]
MNSLPLRCNKSIPTAPSPDLFGRRIKLKFHTLAFEASFALHTQSLPLSLRSNKSDILKLLTGMNPLMYSLSQLGNSCIHPPLFDVVNSTLLYWCMQTVCLPIPVIPLNCKCWNKLFE